MEGGCKGIPLMRAFLQSFLSFQSNKEFAYEGCVVFCDNLPLLQLLPDASIDLIYIDPPFNTGKAQKRLSLRTVADPEKGDRIGFGGRRYQTLQEGKLTYADSFEDYLEFLRPRLEEAHRVLKPSGSLYFHIDYREAHYCKVL
ncbi:MAG: DNA methyltransferase, partial [Bacteroidia bacterium]|nr:DNA methyltransferase [Bacteroidia bacterium]